LGIWQRLSAWLRGRKERFNLEIEPAYAIKMSARNPYFQGLERTAREAGCLGAFVVDDQGWLRQGSRSPLPTRRAQLFLDVYPNPAALEARTIGDYDYPRAPRRVPRATLVLDDGSELFLWFERRGPRVVGPAVEQDAAGLK